MPELAEVESVRKHLEQLLKGKKIKQVMVDETDHILYSFAPAQDVRKALEGSRITGSGRKGKYFWFKLNKKPWPMIHLGMTGSVTVMLPKNKKVPVLYSHSLKVESLAKQKKPDRLWFCRFLLKMEDGTQVALIDPRRFGRIWLSENPEAHARVQKLGYDPLLDFPPAKKLYELITRRRIAIKTILLNQALFAGVGNYLADEILFNARISPHKLGHDFSLKDVTKLRKFILSIVKKAVALDANYEKFPKTWLFHHRWGKSKKAQVSTGHAITHDEIGGRTTAWVPDLQK
ncbi:MAG: hypothetical protein H7061_04025 [Bdellovibrionaceae bacterium]|nr:hypothetical protein [Bdellovibrio sp.]